MDFFKYLDESVIYKEKNSVQENSLNNMLIDIYRVMHEDSSRNVNKNAEHKI